MKKLAIALLFILLSLIANGFVRGKDVGPFKTPTLQSVVEQSLNMVSERYGIYIKNLNSGESLNIREKESFEAGSLYKLWVMGAVFEKIKNGDLKEDDKLEVDIEDINKRFEISQEDAEMKEGHLQFTISSAIRQMITISHNYAALMLLTKISSTEVGNFLKKYSLNSSSMELPIRTTASDLGSYLEKLYLGEIINKEYSEKMINLMIEQNINNRLPKYLPKDTPVAHKTGDIGYFEHDAGIIYTPKGDYIIVVLTESDFPSDADEKIAELSKAVYEYFNKE